MPYTGIKTKDSVIAPIIRNFVAFRLILILPLYTTGVGKYVRCHTYWVLGGKVGKRGNLAEQAIILGSDNLVAFADAGLQPFPIENRHIAANIANVARSLQAFGSVSNSFATHAQHVGNQI